MHLMMLHQRAELWVDCLITDHACVHYIQIYINLNSVAGRLGTPLYRNCEVNYTTEG